LCIVEFTTNATVGFSFSRMIFNVSRLIDCMLFLQIVLNKKTVILALCKRGGFLVIEVNSIKIVEIVEIEETMLIQRKEVV
jgi:hypothetical protein